MLRWLKLEEEALEDNREEEVVRGVVMVDALYREEKDGDGEGTVFGAVRTLGK